MNQSSAGFLSSDEDGLALFPESPLPLLEILASIGLVAEGLDFPDIHWVDFLVLETFIHSGLQSG